MAAVAFGVVLGDVTCVAAPSDPRRQLDGGSPVPLREPAASAVPGGQQNPTPAALNPPAALGGGAEQLAASRRAWQALEEAAGGNYEYDVAFQSWVGFGHTTTIVVRNGKVVERRLVKFDRNQPQAVELGAAPDGDGRVRRPPEPDRWTETAEQLGSHAEGAAAMTVADLYAEAVTIMAVEPTEDRELSVAYFPNGVLQHCFWIDRRIADDAPRTGPMITAFRMARPANR